MQALMLTAIGKQELIEAPIPAITHPQDVLLKVQSVGVCGSDLHGYLGHSGRRVPPLIMGHELTAEVIDIGAAVSEFAVGDRVAIQPIEFCGTCSQCLAGRRSICENRRIMGMNAPGAYAEYVVWRAGSLVPIPDHLSSEAGALAEPLSIAVHAVSLAHIQPYDTAYVVGAGPIGLLTLAVLKLTGIKRIFISDVSDARLDLALSIGADVAINPSSQSPLDVVQEHTGGQGVDFAFEAVGASATAQQTLEVTRNKGTVIWIGNNHRMVEIDMQAVVTRELSVLGSYGMSQAEFGRSLQMLADGVIPVDRLINRRAQLTEGPGLFDQLLAAPEIIKCMINF